MKSEVDKLCNHISQTGFLPIESKSFAILSLEASKNFKILRLCPGAVPYICKLIPNLTLKLCFYDLVQICSQILLHRLNSQHELTDGVIRSIGDDLT